MAPGVEQLAVDLARLEGQIDGGMATMRAGMAVIGSLLALLIGLVVYSYKQMGSSVEIVRKRTHRLANAYNVVAGKLGLAQLDLNGDS